MNLGWTFYKAYYHTKDSNTNLLTLIENDNKAEAHFGAINEELFQFQLPEQQHIKRLRDYKNVQSFRLKTTYPGLLIGSGYTHGIGALGEIKIGFYFDHTTGLPCLPGSSIKGVLRNAFEKYEDYVASEIEALTKQHPTEAAMKLLVQELFEGKRDDKRISIYEQDSFLEAMVVKGGEGDRVIGSDFITPHKHPLKNPVPIQFIKVLPEVQFEFAFQLKDSQIMPALTADIKTKLFHQILLDLGVGAKTNVGYGQFEEVD